MNAIEFSKNVIKFLRRMLWPDLSSQVLGNCLKQKYNDVSDDAGSMLIKASDKVNENPSAGINCRTEAFGLVIPRRVRARPPHPGAELTEVFSNAFSVE